MGYEFSVSLVSKVLKLEPFDVIFTLSELERRYNIVTELGIDNRKIDTQFALLNNSNRFQNRLIHQLVLQYTRSKYRLTYI